jgi:hypothetical protein
LGWVGRLTAGWAFRLDGVALLLGDGLGEDGGGREGEDEEQLHFSEECRVDRSETESCWWLWGSEVNVLVGWRLRSLKYDQLHG